MPSSPPIRGARTRRVRAIVIGASLAATCALTAGCGGEPSLAEDSLAKALLTTENLGAGWVEEPADVAESTSPSASGSPTEGRSTDQGEGCAAATDELRSLDATKSASVRFRYTSGTLSLANTAGSYTDADRATSVLTTAYEALQDCTSINSKEQGTTLIAKVTTDRATSSDQADRQLNVTLEGEYRTKAGTQPFHAYVTLAQVGANVTSIQTGDVAAAVTQHASYVDIAIDRLAAVVDGDSPARTTAPVPSGRPAN